MKTYAELSRALADLGHSPHVMIANARETALAIANAEQSDIPANPATLERGLEIATYLPDLWEFVCAEFHPVA